MSTTARTAALVRLQRAGLYPPPDESEREYILYGRSVNMRCKTVAELARKIELYVDKGMGLTEVVRRRRISHPRMTPCTVDGLWQVEDTWSVDEYGNLYRKELRNDH